MAQNKMTIRKGDTLSLIHISPKANGRKGGIRKGR